LRDGKESHPWVETKPGALCNADLIKLSNIKAANLREGDKIVVTVARVMGVQGRKPRDGAPLMKLEYEDGTTELLRQDQKVVVVR